MVITSFCSNCGYLLRGKKTVTGSVIYCTKCKRAMNIQEENLPKTKKDNKESPGSILSDQNFIKTKLKPLLINGRESKPIKSLARQLGISENELHEYFKKMDTDGTLPYGYYDKIERTYVRTHIEEEIDETLLLDLISKSYGFKTFHHHSLASNLLIGRQITSRKVLSSLHQLRKQGKLIGFKKGDLWLWKLPNPDEEREESLIENEAQMDGTSNTLPTESGINDSMDISDKKHFYHKKKSNTYIKSNKQNFKLTNNNLPSRNDESIEKSVDQDKELDNEGTSLADLVRWNNSIKHTDIDDDDDNDFEIVFSEDEDENIK